MTVYVDNSRTRARVGRILATWCHLGADTEDELHAFAESIGLKRAWAQRSSSGIPHYDLTESRREAAVAAGALEVDAKSFVRLMHEAMVKSPPGDPPLPRMGRRRVHPKVTHEPALLFLDGDGG